MKYSTIKPKPHLKGSLNNKQTLEHIFWIKKQKTSYTEITKLK